MTLDIQAWKPGNTIMLNGEPWIPIFYMPTNEDWAQCYRNF